MKESSILKKQALRNNEYYSIQDVFDELHAKAKRKYKFKNLMQYIVSRDNILLAYRNIKNNTGSLTKGTDGLTIQHYKNMPEEEFVRYFQNKFKNYKPKSIRRVDIPKPNGKTRPLGIPCMDDRIIQQCIKQVMEPICEAQFHPHSYGFRPNRSTHHAIARTMYLANISKLHYAVDIDIKGFFDNVNHAKLKKQIWSMGIQDKNLISIIGKILKSEVDKIGVPTKGTPQGGILSPLLSNIVLNELDWWISSQWETFETKKNYDLTRTVKRKTEDAPKQIVDRSGRFRAMRNTKLKEVWIVRYADDFKIMCKDYEDAKKIFAATKDWLKTRLGLEISPEKSKITNLRKHKTEFLGIQLKVKLKGKKYVVNSNMSDKALKNTAKKLKDQIKQIQKHNSKEEVLKLNAMILGSHNYYNVATHIVKDFGKINFLVTRTLETRLQSWLSDKPKLSTTYKKLYGEYNSKIRTIHNITLFPIYGCKHKSPTCFNQEFNDYTVEGREQIHTKMGGYSHLIQHLLRNPALSDSVELQDNKLSLIAGQRGKCYVTGEQLIVGKMQCHHKKPRSLGGGDEYKNLIWIKEEVHKLIHAKAEETINKYLQILKLDDKALSKVNSLRLQVENFVI